MIHRKSVRPVSVLAASVLLAAITVAFAGSESSGPVDDPPPEPIDCPMCGGDPLLHAQRMLRLEAYQGRILAYLLRW